METASRRSLTDSLTGFGSRHQLLAELEQAVAPDGSPSVLAIYDLAGFTDYQRVFGKQAAEQLVAYLAQVFARLIQPAGRCYRPREDEFAVLISGPQDRAHTVLLAGMWAIRKECERFLLTTSFGVAILPDEADDVVSALTVADKRLEALTGRGPREGRHSLQNYLDALLQQGVLHPFAT